MNSTDTWFTEDITDEIAYSVKDYDISAIPNDFNTKTIIDFIESGMFKIPGFQRNYVWDIKRASKLIESIIIGLPIPQVFLYQEEKNSFLVIDGQQRLLTLFFFSKKRFPRKEKRAELRQIFSETGKFPEKILHDDSYFEDFKLNLEKISDSQEHPLNDLTYPTLDEYKSSFEMRTIRNIVVKQNLPAEDDSAMFEIFNRLNSGGVVLKPQEIRISLYHSAFYDYLYKMNLYSNWRKILNQQEPDIHMKDVEIILRAFAMLFERNSYKSPMSKFLNYFSKKSKHFNEPQLVQLKNIFENFCDYIVSIEPDLFWSKSGKFSITMFESVFVALCEQTNWDNNLTITKTTKEKLQELKTDKTFLSASQDNTAGKTNVEKRIERAKLILSN